MATIIAHLHPALVHLPIGILCVAVLFDWVSRSKKWSVLGPSVLPLFFLGAFAAALSCVSGWMLGGEGAYAQETLFWHRWLGIGTALAALICCFVKKRLIFSSLTAVLLVVTGHFGGTLTHGEGYLTNQVEEKPVGLVRSPDVRQWQVYAEIISPILEKNCSSCHGSSKQKGGLRLDAPEWISKGGKSGKALVIGGVKESELLRRCKLPLEDEEHMPPKQKAQLSDAELALLHWWIEHGANFQGVAGDYPQPENIQKILRGLAGASTATVPTPPEIPPYEPKPAAEQNLAKIRLAGVHVQSVAQGSNWLSLSFFNLPEPPDSVFAWLGELAPQLVWLNLSGCKIPQNAWPEIGKLLNLTQLDLAQSSVGDADLTHLAKLSALQKINLSRTKVGATGLTQLAGCKNLRSIYLYKTNVAGTDWGFLSERFPHARLDTGGYKLPFLETDTLRLQ